MFCRNCGNSMLDNQRFCTECGTDMSDVINKKQQQNNPLKTNFSYTSTPEYRVTPNNYIQKTIPQEKSEKGTSLAVASFVLGIISIIAFSYGIFSAILGVIFGCVSKSQGCKSSMATAGIVCSAIGASMSVLILLFYFASYDFFSTFFLF